MTIFNKKYKDREKDMIINSMVLLVDTREKEGKNQHILDVFNSLSIPHIRQKLEFADYSFMIPKNEELDILSDIYFNDLVSIEKKMDLTEVIGNITKGRKQFKDELARHKGLMILMIEKDDYKDICEENYRNDVSRQSVLGSLHKFQHEFDVPFIFVSKKYSGIYIHQTFKYYLKYCFDKYPIEI